MQFFFRLDDNGQATEYSLAQFAIDYPNVSMRADPTPEHLEPYGILVGEVLPQPEYNERTQVLDRNPPELIDGRWVIGWSERAATPGEIPREPQWSEWGESLLLPDIRAVSLQINQNAPDIASSLTFGVLNAENDQGAKFLRVWKIALATMPSIAPIVPRMQELAQAHQLPDAFVAALAPSP